MNVSFGAIFRRYAVPYSIASDARHAPRSQACQYFSHRKGQVKVGDLGLSRALSENTMQAHSKVGTPLYMSPEVLRGKATHSKVMFGALVASYELAVLRSPLKRKA